MKKLLKNYRKFQEYIEKSAEKSAALLLMSAFFFSMGERERERIRLSLVSKEGLLRLMPMQ